jgi:cell division protein FtsL
MVRENLAYDFSRFEERKPTEHAVQLKLVEKQKNSKKAMVKSVWAYLAVFAVVATFVVGLLFSYMRSNELSSAIKAAEKRNRELTSQNTLLQVEIDQTFSMKKVSELAESYGMVKAEKYQYKYFTVAEGDKVSAD